MKDVKHNDDPAAIKDVENIGQIWHELQEEPEVIHFTFNNFPGDDPWAKLMRFEYYFRLVYVDEQIAKEWGCTDICQRMFQNCIIIKEIE